ncbi:MAG: hypothetical protein U1C55_11335 [Smithellaceae bacterium]|nr:hypothetical protein [Smithellaceae bacterium]
MVSQAIRGFELKAGEDQQLKMMINRMEVVRGGGRIIGEGCHFIDLLSFPAGEQLIPFAQLVNAPRASFAAVEAARTGKVVTVRLNDL